jgi:hypothetical protein
MTADETMALLRPFCAPPDSFDAERYPATVSPVVFDGHAYGTDSRVCVRVPKGRVAPNPAVLDCWALFPLAAAAAMPAVPPVPDRVPCDACPDVSGWNCDECGGTKLMAPEEPPVFVGGLPFDPAYLRPVAALPGVRVLNATCSGRSCLVFEAAGGVQGCVMGLDPAMVAAAAKGGV